MLQTQLENDQKYYRPRIRPSMESFADSSSLPQIHSKTSAEDTWLTKTKGLGGEKAYKEYLERKSFERISAHKKAEKW